MGESTDLDSLIAAHDRYLDAILQKGLLGPKSQLLTHTLSTLFEARLNGYARHVMRAPCFKPTCIEFSALTWLAGTDDNDVTTVA